jgi:hypothetical protein
MQKSLGMLLLIAGLATNLVAVPIPEIDPGVGGSAVALLSGALLILRSRRKR